jgi:hypothetical protein
MALGGRILDQAGVARTEGVLGAVAEADLQLALKADHELAEWGPCRSETRPTGSARNEIRAALRPLVQAGVAARSIGSMCNWPSLPL